MRRIVCALLVATVFLSSTPVRAATYPQNMFVEEDSASDQECEVAPSSNEESLQEEENAQIESKPQGQEIVPAADQGSYTDQESFVSPATNDSEQKIERKRWQNILLAVGAVIVAVTAMLVVDTNEGHSRHHHH